MLLALEKMPPCGEAFTDGATESMVKTTEEIGLSLSTPSLAMNFRVLVFVIEIGLV